MKVIVNPTTETINSDVLVDDPIADFLVPENQLFLQLENSRHKKTIRYYYRVLQVQKSKNAI